MIAWACEQHGECSTDDYDILPYDDGSLCRQATLMAHCSPMVACAPGHGRNVISLDALCPGLVVVLNSRSSCCARFPADRVTLCCLLGEVGVLSLEAARAQTRQWPTLLAQGRIPNSS